MLGVWTTTAVREAEAQVLAATAPGALMRRAAHAVALHAAGLLDRRCGGVSGRRVVLLVGAGDNGGDALWAGAYLRKRGVGVTAVLLAPDRAHAEGLAALKRAGGRVGTPEDVDFADLVIDGIVGLSASGPLRPDAAAVVARVRAPVVAVDLPSGVDPDTGAVTGPAVTADVTVTFGGRKPVHFLAGGRCGEVHLVDLGLDLPEPRFSVLSAEDVADAWPVPAAGDDKYTQGVVGVAAGSSTYPGAAVLSVGAAVLSTSGLTRYAGSAADEVRRRWPEVIATGSLGDAGRVQAWVAGPGMGTGKAARDVLGDVLGAGVPVCADADAITLLAANPQLWDAKDPDAPVLITPHDREFARIAEPHGIELGTDRVAAALQLAAELSVTVLLKGHVTVIADPTGAVLVNAARSHWLATAGSGDVLSGMIGALLAAGLEPLLAAACAAFVHVRAGELAARGAPAPASAIVSALPDAIRSVLS
ncbi:NAD(P)H-hydrate dehydratase [Actinokineospora globicatena]|uniref:NAD(P)H-hydrate dehydratase n=1 Tax=Actinokineospora globicatena TaxID=103729 RepID=UPI0020A3BE53|nr:NAD(P)H-hydrate dehydratase [Actinokineospora globicatena]MCP2301891.1 yjeF C-terminal region, hydroxyethylthiazole kinase-related/yjeF N-terminal region [Actinokineospora globicatena]GLW76450.1 bifunctional NAD(P)H-hydrate repair enzyme [Actinokineospora globicatena]GLW83285.1 bifunctional NAD(P)H-hydrate repair enzyme [Actinokineospora globicatena]